MLFKYNFMQSELDILTPITHVPLANEITELLRWKISRKQKGRENDNEYLSYIQCLALTRTH